MATPEINLALYVLIAFVIGSIMGGVIVTQLLGGASLRTIGSGNVGATNALRSRGIRFALFVLTIDVMKGLAAVLLVPLLPIGVSGLGDSVLPQLSLSYLCGAAATLGHIFNPWLSFQGGKGAATLLGVFVGIMPSALPWMLGGFVITLLLTGFAGLSTLVSAIFAIFYVAYISSTGLISHAGIFVCCMAVLVTYSHRQNLIRLFNGEENRFEKAMLYRRWRNR